MQGCQKLVLSVVVTTRNRSDDLEKCIGSIALSDYINKFELLIVDDASSDNTKSIVRNFTYDVNAITVKYIRNEVQQMMVRSRNLGAKSANGDYILFVDDDNVVKADMIATLVKFLDENNDVGIVGPSMYHINSQKPYLTYQRISKYTGKTTGFYEAANEYNESDGVPNVFMIRASVLNACGYFDEKIVQTFTEPDFAAAAKLNGFRCVMLRDAITYHRHELSGITSQVRDNVYPQKAYYTLRNRGIYVMRYGTLLNKLIYFGFFAHIWPLLYILISIKANKRKVAILYFWGYVHSLLIYLSGNIPDFDQSIDFVKLKIG